MTPRLRQLDRWLGSAERSVALLERCQPLNATAELHRLRDCWRHGRERSPVFRYPRPVNLSAIRRALDTLCDVLDGLGPWGRLYAQRSGELSREALLVEAIGKPEFRELANRRFEVAAGPDERQARFWALQWTANSVPSPAGASHRSDDEGDPLSLLSTARREIGSLRLPFRVVVSPNLASAAATGDGVIFIRSGIHCRAEDAARTVAHELYGHALPRHRAQRESLGLFRVGTAGSAEDEEGRALLIEQRSGWFDVSRQRELGRRHLAALAVRAGAEFVQTVRMLLALGTPLGEALQVAVRCYRGGGLAREAVYLPALRRVQAALAREAGLERWMERGRVSVSAVSLLRGLGEPPEHFPLPDAA